MSKRIAYKGPKRVDANQALIINELKACGFSVRDVHEVPEALDVIAGFMGFDVRIEIKDGKKPPSQQKLTEAEATEIATWRGRPIEIVRSVSDVHFLRDRIRVDAIDLSRGKRSRI